MVKTRRKKAAKPPVEEGPNVECEECGRWCYRIETDFESVAEAEESSFTCRSCEKVEDGFRRIEGEWAATVEEFKRELRVEREKRIQLEAQVGDLIKRAEAEVEELTMEWESKVESVAGELRQEREQRAELERQVEELRQGEEWKAGLEEHKRECEDRVHQLTGVVTKEKEEMAENTTVGAAGPVGQVTGDQVVVSVRKEAAQLYSTAVQQGPVKAAEVEAVAGSQVAGVNEEPGNEREETGDMRRRDNAREEGTKNRDGGTEGRMVWVVGSSNVSRCKEAVLRTVRYDDRVQVLAMPGQCFGEVIEETKDKMWEHMRERNLVVVHAGLNDVLKGKGRHLAKQIQVGGGQT